MDTVARPLPRRVLAGQLMYGMLWVGVTLFGAVLRPEVAGHGTHEQLGLPPCPSALFWDRPCPGCGLTTSFSAFIHGNLPLAFHAHPLGPFLYLALTVTGIVAIGRFVQGRRLDVSVRPWSTWILIGAFVFAAFGFIRMALTPHYRSPAETAAFSVPR